MARLWTIRTYVLLRGTDAVAEWTLPPAALAAFDATLEYLAQRTRDEWQRPEFDQLGREGRGLAEIRFKCAGVQYRPIWFFGPYQGEFTMLIGAAKKGNQWNPPAAIETAQRRKREVLADRSRSRIYEF